ncbi:hypothetical protein RJ639_031615 [Escallonia herrerae]|uniref:Rieske domain-containing protein n=1 Tax=Escallonia herrerae TaxID=1293975 RepID=A0AA88WZB1_9ASTE|nr:hypothetical protein RJ639_031615 [Escallonia herrerae]
METLRASFFSSYHRSFAPPSLLRTQFDNPILHLPLCEKPISPLPSLHSIKSKSKLFTAISPSVSTEFADPPEQETEVERSDEKFDWLAPLSEGRIDQWGRLQCVYHGWCFGSSGECKFIPQAPTDGPPIHTNKKARVAAYPSTVQNDIVWFWPNSDPQYKDILTKKKPPCIPELDDPSYSRLMGNRDIPYGYEVLAENLMDPAHVPYAHYGIMVYNTAKADREGGRPLEISVEKLVVNGFTAKQEPGGYNFIAPCVFYGSPMGSSSNGSAASSTGTTEESSSVTPQRRLLLIFICIPVSPGNSRLIYSFPRNFAVWIDRIVPRWMFHVGQNLILDSDLYLLHIEERKILDASVSNWQKDCFVPTKSDALVIIQKVVKEVCRRYWSHVVNCRSCSVAYKGLNALEVALQIISIASIAIVAASKQGFISAVTRNTLVIAAVFTFVASKWLSHFIYKNFRFHDYNHAFR